MMIDEAMRLKEELDSVKAKADELHKELCAQQKEKEYLSIALKEESDSLAQALRDIEFLRGKVEAYEFVIKEGIGL